MEWLKVPFDKMFSGHVSYRFGALAMTIFEGGRVRLAVAATLAATILGLGTVRAQRLAGARDNANPDANNPLRSAIDQGPMDLPPVPPRGAWGEVIMANSKWMVIQNHEGQQFPIANDSVAQFLVRWPTSLDQLTPATVVEAIGQDVGNNSMRTDHVDVFEGPDRALVQATFASLLPNNRVVTTIDPGFNRFMNGFDIGAQNLLYGWAYPLDNAGPIANGIPGRLHVVGNAVSVNPFLRISVLGTNFATVLPDEAGGMSVTQMTRGDTSFAEKGDLVFLMPTELTPRTVVLSQVVLYKKIALRQFQRPDR